MPIPALQDIISRAEAEVRAAIEKALADGQYEEVAEGARIADALARIQTGAPAIKAAPPSANSSAAPDAGMVVDALPRRARKDYPRFVRDGERLVKVAWSKRDKTEYSHRAPRQMIQLVVEKIRKKKGDGKAFQIADILPLRHPETRQEVPSYQAYLVIAWLRQLALVSKRGRDRYILKPAASPEKLAEAWDALPVEV